jgi:hypothetical protein
VLIFVSDHHFLDNFIMFLVAAFIVSFIFDLYEDEFESLIFHLTHKLTIIFPLSFEYYLLIFFQVCCISISDLSQ